MKFATWNLWKKIVLLTGVLTVLGSGFLLVRKTSGEYFGFSPLIAQSSTIVFVDATGTHSFYMTGTSTFNGLVGINTAPTRELSVVGTGFFTKTISSTSTNNFALDSETTVIRQTDLGSGFELAGSFGFMSFANKTNNNSSGTLDGYFGSAVNASAGTGLVASLNGSKGACSLISGTSRTGLCVGSMGIVRVNNSGLGDIGASLYAAPIEDLGGGANLNTWYGVLIGAPTGVAVNEFSLGSLGGNSFFLGNTAMGASSTPASTLEVFGSGVSSTNVTTTLLSVTGLTLFMGGVTTTGSITMQNLPSPGVTDNLVCVDSSGKLRSQATNCLVSSQRYKHDIVSWGDGLATIMNLHPVEYKRNADNVDELGLIAEEVEKVDPRFAVYNKDGQINSVDYARLVVPLISSIQTQQKEIESLKKEIELLKKKTNK